VTRDEGRERDEGQGTRKGRGTRDEGQVEFVLELSFGIGFIDRGPIYRLTDLQVYRLL
jgi:hypothetical protein